MRPHAGTCTGGGPAPQPPGRGPHRPGGGTCCHSSLTKTSRKMDVREAPTARTPHLQPAPAPHPPASPRLPPTISEPRRGLAHRPGPADEHTSTPAVPRRCRQRKPEPGPAGAAGTGAAAQPRTQVPRPRPPASPRPPAPGCGRRASPHGGAGRRASHPHAPACLRGRTDRGPHRRGEMRLCPRARPAAADRPGWGPASPAAPAPARPPRAPRPLDSPETVTSETRAPSPAPGGTAAPGPRRRHPLRRGPEQPPPRTRPPAARRRQGRLRTHRFPACPRSASLCSASGGREGRHLPSLPASPVPCPPDRCRWRGRGSRACSQAGWPARPPPRRSLPPHVSRPVAPLPGEAAAGS